MSTGKVEVAAFWASMRDTIQCDQIKLCPHISCYLTSEWNVFHKTTSYLLFSPMSLLIYVLCMEKIILLLHVVLKENEAYSYHGIGFLF